MARKVEAVLAWLTDTPGATRTPAAKELGAEVRAMLQARFGDELTLVEHANEQASESEVLTSLQTAVERLQDSPGGVLVIAFSGHGVDLGGTRLAWQMHDAMLMEEKLHEKLEGLPAEVEVVLVVDCCFASNVLPVSVRLGLPKLVLRWWPRLAVPDPAALARLHRMTAAMVRRLSRSASDSPTRSVICVAATNAALVRVTVQDNIFARCLHQTVVPSPPAQYTLVDDRMIQIRNEMATTDPTVLNSQEDWQVVYQPDAAGDLLPFQP